MCMRLALPGRDVNCLFDRWLALRECMLAGVAGGGCLSARVWIHVRVFMCTFVCAGEIDARWMLTCMHVQTSALILYRRML